MAITILSIDPVNGSIGVPTDQSVKIVFDTPMDIESLGNGNVFIVGSAKDHIGNKFYPLLEAERKYLNNPLEDPAYGGIVLASHKVKYMNTDFTYVAADFKDTSGTASYYTEVEVVPLRPLEPHSLYKVYISGQQYTSIPAGVHRRTVFDPFPGVGNIGTSVIYSGGTYDGSVSAAWEVQITQDGGVHEGKYRWRKNLVGNWLGTRVIHSNLQPLSEGVMLRFDIDGDYVNGDSYTFLSHPKEYMTGIAVSELVTGQYGVTVDLGNLSATHLPGLAPSTPPTQPSNIDNELYVKYTVFKNYKQIDLDTEYIIFHFNKDLSVVVDTHGITIDITPILGPDCKDKSSTSYFANNYEVVNNTLKVYLENT